jgi:hypothetical protein
MAALYSPLSRLAVDRCELGYSDADIAALAKEGAI